MRASLIVVAVLLSACATTQETAVSQPEVAGEYTLLAVNNHGLPELLPEMNGVEVIAGKLLIDPNGTLEARISLRAQMSSLEPLVTTRRYQGTYARSNAGLTVTFPGDSARSGRVFGKTLQVRIGSSDYLFFQ